jgi:hypothetical protein
VDFEGAIQNAFLRRDARQQFRSFARPNQVLRQSPSPTPTGFAKILSEDLPELHAHLKCGERILESRINPGHRKFITL